MCVGVAPVAVVPSPKFHRYVKGLLFGSVTPKENCIDCPSATGLGVANGPEVTTGGDRNCTKTVPWMVSAPFVAATPIA